RSTWRHTTSSALEGRGVCSSICPRGLQAHDTLLPVGDRELLAVLPVGQPGDDRVEDRQRGQPGRGLEAQPVELIDDEDPQKRDRPGIGPSWFLSNAATRTTFTRPWASR